MQQSDPFPAEGNIESDSGDVAAGRFRLETRPLVTGSSLLLNTIGIVVVPATMLHRA